MKRRFTILTAALALLVSLAIPMGVWGQTYTQVTELDLTTKDYGNSAYNSNLDYTSNNHKWNIVYGANNNKGWAYFKMGGKSATLSSCNPCYIYNKTAITEQVDKVTVHLPSGSLSKQGMSVNSWGLYVYSDASLTTQVDYVAGGTITNSEGSFDFTPSTGVTWTANYYYKVSWDLANTTTTNGIVCVDKITLYKAGSTTTPSMSVSPNTIAFGDQAINPSTPYTQTFNVTFANLTENLTITGFSGVTVSPASINYNATSPQTVTVSYNPTAVGSISGNISVNSSEVDEQLVAVTGSAYDPENVDTYELYNGTIVEGDYVICYEGQAMKNTVSSNRLGYMAVTPINNEIVNPNASIVWHIAQSGNYWTIYNENVNKYAAGTTSKNQAALLDEATSDLAKWIIPAPNNGSYNVENFGRASESDPNNKFLRYNSGYGYACYASGTGGALSLYKKLDSGIATTTTINEPQNFNTDIYQGTNAGTLTATVKDNNDNAISGATVTWSSSNNDVATIDANGAVTLVAVGTTTITASYAGVTDQYRPSSATYSLEVTDSTPVFDATFIFNTDEGLADLNITKPNAGSGTDLDANHDYVIGIVTMIVTHASTPTRIWGLSGGATELRAYSGSTLTFRVPSGYAVTKVTFTGSALPYSELTNGVWTSTGDPVSTVTFNCTNTAKVSTITVEYEENASIVAAPTLPTSTNFYPEMTVEITNNTSGATVYYTTDGSDPKTSNTRIEYTQAFTLNATTTVKAVALKDSNYSQVVEATYTLVDVLDTMQAVFNAAGDETTNVFINFNNYVVSGISTNGKSVFVTDNSGNGFVIFNNNGGLDQTYSVGSILSGTAVPCNLVKYNGFAELLNVDASNLTITAGGTVSTSNIAMADLAGVNTGALVSYENLTCSVDNSGDTPKYYLTDGTTTLQVYNSLYAFNALENGKKYNITGIYQQYHDGKEILPRSAADIVPIFTKHITGYTNNGGYYLIASPIGTVDPEEVTNMITDDDDNNNRTYDLYRFDQNPSDGLEWRNYRQEAFDLNIGQGYLYAHRTDVDLVFTGSAISESTYNVPLTKSASASGHEFPDWNLVGNPFADVAHFANNHPFYTLDVSGAYTLVSDGSQTIESMQGVFVVAGEDEAGEDEESITFVKGEPSAKSPKVTLNVSKGTEAGVIDRAIVCFGETRQMPKFQLFKNSTKVYIPMEGKDYALVRGEEMGAMPVNFKAEENGTYSMNFSCENVGFAYLHLIDNKTGNDVDLLQTPSYSFEAKTTDYESRFKLVFATGDNSDDDTFAFFSNGSFVINNPSTGSGPAELQVIDITGRIVKSESINGCTNVNVNAAAGVYMLRLINGDNVKVQKVVVK